MIYWWPPLSYPQSKTKQIILHLDVRLELIAQLEGVTLDERAPLAVDETDQLHRVAVAAFHYAVQGRYHLLKSKYNTNF